MPSVAAISRLGRNGSRRQIRFPSNAPTKAAAAPMPSPSVSNASDAADTMKLVKPLPGSATPNRRDMNTMKVNTSAVTGETGRRYAPTSRAAATAATHATTTARPKECSVFWRELGMDGDDDPRWVYITDARVFRQVSEDPYWRPCAGVERSRGAYLGTALRALRGRSPLWMRSIVKRLASVLLLSFPWAAL